MKRIEHKEEKWFFPFVEYSCDVTDKKLPLVIRLHGAVDSVVSVTQSDEMVRGIENSGGNVKYTRLDGVDHNAWDYTFDREFMEWLLDKKR